MAFLYFFFFILGSTIGSFLNVVIDRTAAGKSILGRSYCDHCRAKLSSVDLVPILSFVGLGGRCRFCKRKISWQYPIVEALTGFLFVLTFYHLALGGEFSIIGLLFYFLVIAILVVVAVVDFKFSLIPTTFVYIGAIVALFYDYFHLSSDDFVRTVLLAFVMAALFGLVVIITRGRGMGTGDIPLVFMISLVLGWPQVIVGVFLAFVFGATMALLLIATRRKRFGQTVPFAPFLALGSLVAFFVGDQILSWYLGVL